MDTEDKFVSWLKSNATKRVCLDLSILDLIAIHGNICLGLRHPDNTGPTRQIAANVVDIIEQIFKDTGMEDDVMSEIHKVEAEETAKLMESKRKGDL
jgi:hypothetical protein